MAESGGEEQFLFVVQSDELAATLNEVLNAAEGQPQPQLQLHMHTQRVGHLKINVRGVEEGYAVTVHEMPTLVETFKSHNHVNLVKSADIGQAVLLHNSSNPTSSEDLDTALSALMQMEQNGELPQYIGMGVTPPMASGAQVFKKRMKASPKLVGQVETQIIDLMHGEAPDGWVIEDVAEVYLDEENAGKGKWVPLSEVPTDVIKTLAHK